VGDLRCECEEQNGEITPGVFLRPIHVARGAEGDDFRCPNQATGEDGRCDSCRASCRMKEELRR
jgi:hypothetical protein